MNAETEDWASVNFMLVKSDNTGFVERFSGSKKDRNIVTSTAVSCTDTKLEVFMGSGGMIASKAMIRSLLGSGKYDDKVEHRHDVIKNNTSPPPNMKYHIHDDENAMEILHAKNNAARKVAKQVRTCDDCVADPNSGSLHEEVDRSDLSWEARPY